jgi:uncharacterized membrane protein
VEFAALLAVPFLLLPLLGMLTHAGAWLVLPLVVAPFCAALVAALWREIGRASCRERVYVSV